MEHAFVAAIRAYYSNGVDFIEPLDVSTIFGNGLDNAIEASEKLPEEQRAILVKAGKMQNFFSVLIENNCLQDSGNTKSRTTKNDDFLHGFGISNMHFGMGLYITSSIIKQHDGQLVLSNSKKTGGAQVIIKIPY